VPASKVYSTSDIISDPHYAAREQVLTVESAQFGPLLQPGIVPRLTETPGRVRSRAPLLGEHNEEVYAGELGLSREDLASLREGGIV
jgi:crotonobetainyl-CoA:carnitine CoA-transferase CaiB-like acyl-CoA transferase